MAGAADIPAFRSMRTLRALRPLRAVSRWEGMRVSKCIRKQHKNVTMLFRCEQIINSIFYYIIQQDFNVSVTAIPNYYLSVFNSSVLLLHFLWSFPKCVSIYLPILLHYY